MLTNRSQSARQNAPRSVRSMSESVARVSEAAMPRLASSARSSRPTARVMSFSTSPHERRGQLEHEQRAPEADRRAGPLDRHGQPERPREQRRGDSRAAALHGDGDARQTARRGDDDRLWWSEEQEETGERNHPRRARTWRASSRSSARRFRSARLSCSCFALARAIAILATPSLKYSSSGTIVSPLRLVPPISLRISCAWSSNLRERAGGGLL